MFHFVWKFFGIIFCVLTSKKIKLINIWKYWPFHFYNVYNSKRSTILHNKIHGKTLNPIKNESAKLRNDFTKTMLQLPETATSQTLSAHKHLTMDSDLYRRQNKNLNGIYTWTCRLASTQLSFLSWVVLVEKLSLKHKMQVTSVVNIALHCTQRCSRMCLSQWWFLECSYSVSASCKSESMW